MPDAKLCLLSMLIIVAGCTTQPNKVANDGPDVQCHSVETTGSLITRTVCTTRDQRAAQQALLSELSQRVETGAGAPTRPAAPR
jgi:hypothetical protein